MNAGIKIKKYKDKSILYCLKHNIKTVYIWHSVNIKIYI